MTEGSFILKLRDYIVHIQMDDKNLLQERWVEHKLKEIERVGNARN